jgi:hypothetical protein
LTRPPFFIERGSTVRVRQRASPNVLLRRVSASRPDELGGADPPSGSLLGRYFVFRDVVVGQLLRLDVAVVVVS